MKAKRKAIRVFDMFCGAGGSSCGAQMAGGLPVAGLDMCGLAAATYRRNFPDAVVYHSKASLLCPATVMADVGGVDLLLASPECTSHSVAKGAAPRCEKSRATAFEVIRFARMLRPRWIVVENVLQMRYWKRFDEWHEKLRKLGYHTNIGVIDAQDHGTPQSRKRLFILADLATMPCFPKRLPGRKKTVARILMNRRPDGRPWPFRPVRAPERARATLRRAKRAMDTLGTDRPYIMVYYGSDGAGGFQTIDRPLRTVTTLDRFALVRPNGAGHEMRMLQPPELALAMGFPAMYEFCGTSRRARIRLIGNAVCPPVMRDIVASLTAGA